MKIGLHIGKFHWPGSPENISDKLTEIARVADENDFYSIWVMDHVFQLGDQFGIVHGPEEAEMLEAYTTISYLAGKTKKIKLGTQVTCNFFRNPALLVKMVTNLDVLSKGRAYFGIGAGWFEREAVGYGYEYPSLKIRFEMLEESLKIFKHMFAGKTEPFEGKHFTLQEPINSPPPVTKPHPPILIGGSGEKKTLRFVAKYADACNIVLGTTFKNAGRLYDDDKDWDFWKERLEHKYAVLRGHCEDIGRPYEEVEKTATTYIELSPESMSSSDVLNICRKLSNAGCEHLVFNMPNVDEIKPLEVMGKEVIPEVLDY